MSASNKKELAAVASTELATMPPAQRAAVVLGSAELRTALTALAASTKDIVAVIDKAGREQVHAAGMALRSRRTSIKSAGEAAREDANKFATAVIAEQKALTLLIEPEETRLLALRDAYDAAEEARKQAERDIEIARIKKIDETIDNIVSAPVRHIASGSAKLADAITFYEIIPITTEDCAEFAPKAEMARGTTLEKLREMHAKALAAEEAVAAAEAARLAEIERMAAERAELARLRAEADERDRLAKIESDRIAAEHAAESKRLRGLAAAQEAELQKMRDAEAARVRAEQAERDRVAAESRRQMEAQQAAIAAERRALEDQKAEVVRGEKMRSDAAELWQAMADNFDDAFREYMQRAVDAHAAKCAEKQAMADQAVADARAAATDERTAGLPAGALGVEALADMQVTDGPSDDEIVTLVAATFCLSTLEAVERLAAIDFDTARELASA